jgi:cytoskeleton-associated protein 5
MLSHGLPLLFAVGAGSAGIPRQDLSVMLDKNIVSELGFVDGKTSWQRRKAALESIVSCCDRSSHFLDANKATSEILKALKPRMSDTQANLKPLAVSAIGHIVASLDAETSGVKVLRVMAPIMMLGLGDNKKAMRDATIVALHHAVTSQLQPEVSSPTAAAAPLSVAKANSSMMSSLLPAVIEVLANPVGRQEILEWFLLHVESLKGDWTEIASPLVITIQDKSAAVRQAGEQLLTALLAASLVSRTTLDKATRDLPPATKRAMQAAIDRMMSAAGTGKLSATSSSMESLTMSQDLTKAQSIPRSASSHSQTPFTSPPRMMVAAEPTATTTATNLPVPVVRRSGILQPKSTSSASTHSDEQATAALHHRSTPASTIKPSHSVRAGGGGTPSPGSASKWLLKRNAAGKLRRPDEGHQSWPQPPEVPGEAEMTALKTIWKPLVTPDLLYLLFPSSNTPSKHGLSFNQDSFVPALNELTTQLECPHLTHHTEYILRWSCVVLSLKLESSSGLYKLLQFLCEVFQAISAVETGANILTDGEASYIIPHLIDRAGHRSERHQAMFRKAISIASSIMSTSKLAIMLIRSLKSPNKRTRVICLEEVRVLVEGCSAASIIGVIGHSAVNQMALLLDAKDCDVACRNACLETICAVFFCLGRDFNAMKRLIGNDVSDQALVLIEERIELKNKQLSSDGGSSVLRTDSNRDDDSTIRSDSCNTLSPNSEMRSHRMLLDQIDAVMASTPLPANRTRVVAVSSPAAAAADASRSPPAIHTPTAGNGRTLSNEVSAIQSLVTDGVYRRPLLDGD